MIIYQRQIMPYFHSHGLCSIRTNYILPFHTRKEKPSFCQLGLLYPYASHKLPNPKQCLKTQLTIPKHYETCHSRIAQLLDWSDKPSFTSYYA